MQAPYRILHTLSKHQRIKFQNNKKKFLECHVVETLFDFARS